MNNKLRAAFLSLLCVIIVLSSLPLTICAQDARDAAQSIVDGVISYKLTECGVENAQQLLSGDLARNAGNSEWYVLSLAQSGEYDLSSYRTSLLDFLDGATGVSAASRQKYALLLVAAGAGDDPYVADVMENTVGESGLMSFVFALHLMNNGCESSRYSALEVPDELLSLQNSDGSWALIGNAGDVDATAMTLQALAPMCDENSEIRASAEHGVEFLSERQRENGGYASFGAENPESSAQVICALSALGIDAASDERFIKNGRTVFDALESFRLTDGSFCHELGGASNESATVQSLYGALSYVRMKDGKSPFYILDDNASPDKPTEQPDGTASVAGDEELHPSSGAADVGGADAGKTDGASGKVISPKIIIISALVTAAAVVLVILAVLRKINKKSLTATLLVLFVLCVLVAAADIKTADEYYSPTEENAAVGAVTLNVRCDTVAGQADGEYIPKDGVILDKVEMPLGEGESVYDILVKAAREYKIHLDVSTSGSAYVKGIAYLYEFDFGDLSGWMYSVNGEMPSVSAADYLLSDGDEISWQYTCDLGRDLEQIIND